MIIPILARKYSNSETFLDSEREIRTIGGGSNKKRSASTRLDTLKMGQSGTENAIRVEVTVDQERNHSALWESEDKGATFVGDDDSVIESPTKTHGASAAHV